MDGFFKLPTGRWRESPHTRSVACRPALGGDSRPGTELVRRLAALHDRGFMSGAKCLMGRVARQPNSKRSSLIFRRGEGNFSAVRYDNLLDDAQAKADAALKIADVFACIAEKGLEDEAGDVGGYRRTVIVDVELNAFACGTCCDVDEAIRIAMLNRIGD